MEHVMRPFTAVIAVVLLMAATILNAWQPVNVYMNTYSNIGYLVGAFAAIWAILAICIVLEHIPADRFLFPAIIHCGCNTLVSYCVNAPIYGSLIPSILGWKSRAHRRQIPRVNTVGERTDRYSSYRIASRETNSPPSVRAHAIRRERSKSERYQRRYVIGIYR